MTSVEISQLNTNVNVDTKDHKMGIALVKLKILPESPSTDLEAIKTEAQEKIKSQEGNIGHFEEEEIAFGLKALIATINWPEEKDTDLIENTFKNIKGVSSVDIIDYRRSL